MVVLGALAAGLAIGAGWTWWSEGSTSSGPSSAIEWNAVQPVPKRVPDAEDAEWEKRSEDDSSVIASPEGARQSSQASAVEEGGLPRGSAARNDRLYVIDGDTFGIGGRHIRIAGIDAPETHPPRCLEEARLGLAATAKLKELLANGTVTLNGSGHDQYGRELRSVQVGGQDVGEAMIAAGLARSYSGGRRGGWC